MIIKKTIVSVVALAMALTLCSCASSKATEEGRKKEKPSKAAPALTLIGHASVKIKTEDGTIIYIDPSYSEIDGGYDDPADIVLITHKHGDHNRIKLIKQKDGCKVITYKEAHPTTDEYLSFDVKGVKIETVAAQNSRHLIETSVGYVVSFDELTVYHAGDTSTLDIVSDALSKRTIDYALYPIDGKYNMDAEEAASFANSVGAKKNIPMHIDNIFDDYNDEKAHTFTPDGALYVKYGETIELK